MRLPVIRELLKLQALCDIPKVCWVCFNRLLDSRSLEGAFISKRYDHISGLCAAESILFDLNRKVRVYNLQ